MICQCQGARVLQEGNILVPCSCLAEARRAAQAQLLWSQSGLAPFPRLHTWTLETFLDRSDKAKDAKRLILSYLDDPVGWLYLSGDYQEGKTHLGVGAVLERLSRGEAATFLPVVDLLKSLRGIIGGASEDEIRHYWSSPFLVLDDIRPEGVTDWVAVSLYQLINFRYNAGSPTIFTSNLTVTALRKVIPSVGARLSTQFVTRVTL